LALLVRPVDVTDAEALRALVRGQLEGTRYCARLLEQLDAALTLADAEYEGIVAIARDDARIVGLALMGPVAGAAGVVKLHALLADDRGALDALVESARETSAASGTRMLVCELPDDDPFLNASRALCEHGFVEESRVEDLVSDGVALRLLVLRP
jgi:hypothetical protein